MKLTSRTALLSVTLLAALAAPAAAAKVDVPVTPPAKVKVPAAPPVLDCVAPTLSSALTAFGDSRSYFLAPGADFESAAHGWTLTGGARLTSGSGPLGLGRAKRSLRLPAGSSATSPLFCVDLDYPTFRFFSRQLAKHGAGLTVDVIYPALGTKKPKASSLPGTTTAWKLSRDVALKPKKVDKAGGWRRMQLRFNAAAGKAGSWRIDDVLIDPRMRL